MVSRLCAGSVEGASEEEEREFWRMREVVKVPAGRRRCSVLSTLKVAML